MDTTEQEQKREYIRVYLRKHREKMKAISGTTYTPSQKKSSDKLPAKSEKIKWEIPQSI